MQQSHLLYELIPDAPKPLIMGILNVTPDSFSDGKQYFSPRKAINRAKEMINQGAHVIDIGGESTRPGAAQVSADEEIKRVLPIIKAIRKISSIPISIDTQKAAVAELSILAGANIINDVSALGYDERMVGVVKRYPKTALILMHMQGNPQTMQINPQYQDVVREICEYMYQKIEFCRQHSISENRLLIDPGIGFGKTTAHNLTILARLTELQSIGLPLVLGASRKRFISELYASEPNQRLGGTLAVTAVASQHNIDILRVHDVREHSQFLAVFRSITGKQV